MPGAPLPCLASPRLAARRCTAASHPRDVFATGGHRSVAGFTRRAPLCVQQLTHLPARQRASRAESQLAERRARQAGSQAGRQPRARSFTEASGATSSHVTYLARVRDRRLARVQVVPGDHLPVTHNALAQSTTEWPGHDICHRHPIPPGEPAEDGWTDTWNPRGRRPFAPAIIGDSCSGVKYADCSTAGAISCHNRAPTPSGTTTRCPEFTSY